MFSRMKKRKRKKTGSGPAAAPIGNPPRLGRVCAGFRRSALCAVLACAPICLLVVCVPRSSAKEKKPVTKTIAGVILDGADNPIVGAAVELSDVQDNKKFAKYSQKDGRYQFTDLDPKHDYEVQVSFKGLSSEVRKVSTIDDRRIVVLNFTLTANTGRNDQ
jgi:Carboxypeptidase regulatory-like domain